MSRNTSEVDEKMKELVLEGQADIKSLVGMFNAKKVTPPEFLEAKYPKDGSNLKYVVNNCNNKLAAAKYAEESLSKLRGNLAMDTAQSIDKLVSDSEVGAFRMDDRTPGQASNTDLGYHILRLQVFIAAASVKNDIEARSRTDIQLVPKREGVERPLHNRALARGQAQMLLAIAGVDEAIELAQTGKFKPVEVALGLFLNCDRRTHLANLGSLKELPAVAFEYAKQFCKTLSGDDKNSVPIRSAIAQAIDDYARSNRFKSAIALGSISSQEELIAQIDRIEAMEKAGLTSPLVQAVHFMEDIYNSGTGAFIDGMSSKIGYYYDIVDAMKGGYGIEVDERPIPDAMYATVTPTAEEVYGNLQKVVAELVGKIKDPNFRAAATAQEGGAAGGAVQSPQKRRLAASRGRRPGNVAASVAVDLPSPQGSAGGHFVTDRDTDGRSSSPATDSLSSGGGSPTMSDIPKMTAPPALTPRTASRPSVRGVGILSSSSERSPSPDQAESNSYDFPPRRPTRRADDGVVPSLPEASPRPTPRRPTRRADDGVVPSLPEASPRPTPRRPTRRRKQAPEQQFVEQIFGSGAYQFLHKSFDSFVTEELTYNSVDPSIWDQQTSQEQFAAVLQDFKRNNEGNIASLLSDQPLEKISGFIAEKGDNIVKDLVQRERSVAATLPRRPTPDYAEEGNAPIPAPIPAPRPAPRAVPRGGVALGDGTSISGSTRV